MKKTIAILLILVIGMVGVFAATKNATLNLGTTIELVNRLAITDYETEGYTFGEITEETPEATTTSFDPESAYVPDTVLAEITPSTLAAHIHYKTNNAGPVSITFSATALVNETDSSLMPYKMTVGGATVSATTADATNATGYIFNELVTNAGMVTSMEKVYISIPGSSDNYAAGDYVATVTFTLTAS